MTAWRRSDVELRVRLTNVCSVLGMSSVHDQESDGQGSSLEQQRLLVADDRYAQRAFDRDTVRAARSLRRLVRAAHV